MGGPPIIGFVNGVLERRSGGRVREEFPLWYRTGDSGCCRRSLALDLGEGGVRFVSPEPIAPGTEIYLSVKLGEQGYLDLVARAVWEKAEGWRSRVVGALIRACSPCDRRILRKLVQSAA